ncbi:GGDEF domain-containing protein [Kaistia algarum]|uniref:GGDEF domain-containing protein n=1 Tax=Kaistia algarum TaxID=2083279 RepID=UPI0038993FA9
MKDLLSAVDVRGLLFGLVEDAQVLVAAYDPSDRLRIANAAFRSAFFIEPEETPLWSEIMRRNHRAGRGTVILNPDFDAWLTSTQSRRGKVGFRAYETDLADGRWIWMAETVRPDGWMLCIASDVTSIRADERTVRQDRDLAIRAAYTDELTGIANRRFVTERITAMVETPRGLDDFVGCVALFDLDHFKDVNDHYGHATGDILLRDFSRRMQDQLRRGDCFGRIGGEEFVLVLPATPPDQAALILERMLAVARRARPVPELPEVGYTFSAGLAEAMPGDHPEDVIRRADNALYGAKLGGRNRIRLYNPPHPPAASG